MYGAKSIIESIVRPPADDCLDEGLGAIAASKLSDLAKGFILKPRPILVLHNPETNLTVSLKLKRGLIRHSLIRDEEDGGSKTIDRSPSAAHLLTKAMSEAGRLMGKGYLEI